MVKDVLLAHVKVGGNHDPFIIAEMSGNHKQSLNHALKIVEAAAKSGVHALKLQTYTADTMTLDSDQEDFFIRDTKSLWKGEFLYKLYEKAHTPSEWHKPIFALCKELGILCFSTPFDESAVDFLESLDVPFYKIASFENTHLPLIRKIAQTGKPIIISTGMASVSEIDEAVKTMKMESNDNIILLKCTSSYPASPEDSNILTIPHMSQLFSCQVGLSDHTLGIGVAVASVVLGATVIEKHFTLSRLDGGVDAAFSLEPHEMEQLVVETKRAKKSLGNVNYMPTEKEKKSMQFRRSIYVAADVKKGDVFTRENLRVIRPGYGLAPRYFEKILGSKVVCDIKKGTPCKWDFLGQRGA